MTQHHSAPEGRQIGSDSVAPPGHNIRRKTKPRPDGRGYTLGAPPALNPGLQLVAHHLGQVFLADRTVRVQFEILDFGFEVEWICQIKTTPASRGSRLPIPLLDNATFSPREITQS